MAARPASSETAHCRVAAARRRPAGASWTLAEPCPEVRVPRPAVPMAQQLPVRQRLHRPVPLTARARPQQH
jgi:hypothetical protein